MHLQKTGQKVYSRRSFTSTIATVGAGLNASTGNAAAGLRGVNREDDEPIRLGFVGLGSRGFNLMEEFLRIGDCRVVAVCDVDEHHYRDRPWGNGKSYGRRVAAQLVRDTYSKLDANRTSEVEEYSDFRRMISRDSLDAVVIATPDHWHALCAVEAIRSGKDVYCEKPITHLFAEGQAVVSSVQQAQAVFQTGSQQRSSGEFQRLVTLARNGVIGKIRSVEVGLPKGYSSAMGSTKVIAPRKSLDYDFWCGPSPVLPLMAARHHRWWRGHRAYGGGVLMDWIGHHNDIAHWAIGAERTGPTLVESVDWKFPSTDVYDTPAAYTIRCEYIDGVTSTISTENRQGLKLIGDRGWLFADRGRLEASDKRWLDPDFRPGDWSIARTGGHAENFLSCIRSRCECIAPADVAHRSITPGHLGYVSHRLGMPLEWDHVAETVTNSQAADKLLKSVDYRTPWKALTTHG